MTLKLLLPALFISFLPLAAMAATVEECRQQCLSTEESCSADAEQAIYDGSFSGHECSGYAECANVINQCRADTQTCEAACG
jgi:hypothetical protein